RPGRQPPLRIRRVLSPPALDGRRAPAAPIPSVPGGGLRMLIREIDPAAKAHINKFERELDLYLRGELEKDVFRVFRLNNGIYGQRQGGHNQMVRIKVPYGSLTPEQLDMCGHLADKYSRGWGHITTRQNIQFHFVDLERVPALLRDMASVGLTSREACG